MESPAQEYRVRRKKWLGYLLEIVLAALFIAVVFMLMY